MAVARALYVATAVVWLLVELRASRQRRPEAQLADRGTRGLIRLFAVAGALAAAGLRRGVPATDIHPVAVAAWLGLVVLCCGVGLRLASIRTLGRYFTFTVQTSADQPVIDAGPYRWLRHPGYLGILLAVGGIGVEMGNWLSPLGFVALTAIGVVLRIRVEEGALVAAMGERYVEFTRGRKRLLPYLW